MTDINARIAVIKGWKWHACGECNHEWWQMPDGGVDYNQSDPPQYTTDWRLAGELFCELPKIERLEVAARNPEEILLAICEKWLEWSEG